ncbi:MAG: glycogen debranching enzyme GlgX [Desulfobulbaceae bacterium]|nr:MAG: glycogen debranching enzyme GlgX [Desulfobulbaceae bacterium]
MSKKIAPAHYSAGKPLPLGTSTTEQGINFALFSRHCSGVTLVYTDNVSSPEQNSLCEIALDPVINKTGDIWHILIHDAESVNYYGYRISGESDLDAGIVFEPGLLMLDPYATSLISWRWGSEPPSRNLPRCRIVKDQPFDWGDSQPPKTPLADTIIYELHVRGYTRNPNSGVKHPGTYHGLSQKIPYLKSLGITAVELMPITEWDETDNRFFHPVTGEKLLNYWGYNPLSFFSLKSGLAADPSDARTEFKRMVKAFHDAGIEVLLDMVYNHTGEIGYDGITSMYRGIDNPIYYLLDSNDASYLNYSGCGNTINCNHPVVSDLILDSLRFWVQEMRIDGFRFDLAAIMSRGPAGSVLPDPPLLQRIADDPLLQDTKIIAEAWDASGLYQVGHFSEDPRWLEWNGRFRDEVRSFMRDQPDTTRRLATRIAGSSDLYQDEGKSPLNSINFVTCHDGFTLYDLVSFNAKQNYLNGEQNRDGENHNESWNSGEEGLDVSEEVLFMRQRRMKTFAALLLLSQGIPMITAGDEFCRSQMGNNNSWCQDNETSWLDWSLARKNDDMLSFFRRCITLRKKHRLFRRTAFFAASDHSPLDHDILWFDASGDHADWAPDRRELGFHLSGRLTAESDFFIIVNGSAHNQVEFSLPKTVPHLFQAQWNKIIDTSQPHPDDFVSIDQAANVSPEASIPVPPMSLVVIQGQPRNEVY